jgi:hypothetical protein
VIVIPLFSSCAETAEKVSMNRAANMNKEIRRLRINIFLFLGPKNMTSITNCAMLVETIDDYVEQNWLGV